MAESGIVGFFKVMIFVMLFYSMSITLISYALAGTSALSYVSMFNSDNVPGMEEVGSTVESGLTSQLNVPVIEVAALVFYSGNILVDLLLNFIYAIPEMFGFIISAFVNLFHLDESIVTTLQIFAFVCMNVLYMFGIIQLLTGVRSGRIV